MTLSTTPPPPVPERTAHPFLTHDMIHEIPDAARATLGNVRGPARDVAATIADRPFLTFTGCGTAFFSALLAQRLVEGSARSRLHSEAIPALELAAYVPRLGRDSCAVGISHSGITKATVDALASARKGGAKTVGITHFEDRPIATACDTTLIVGNGPDRSRCHTKCYVTGALGGTIVGLEWAVAAGGLSRDAADARLAALEALPSLQERVLRAVESECAEAATDHMGRRTTFILGSGPNESTVLEAALKLKETSFIAAEGMETEQFLHGSWQALDADALVFVLAPKGPGHERSVDLIRAARTVGAHVIAIAEEGDRAVEDASEGTWSVPAVDEALSPFLHVIPLYLYAYHASVARGHNPDVLRYREPSYWAARQIVFPPGTH